MAEPDRDLLLGALAAKRHHLLGAVDGLTDEQLRTPALPSGWSPIGLIRHVTLGCERYWFETVIAGGALDYWPDDRPDLDQGRPADWRVTDDESTADVIQGYRDAITRSDEILTATRLDDTPAAREPDWPDSLFPDVRSILVHVLLDTATHAGHLDAARELIDGKQHLVL